jgi:hypothetical protein
MTRDIEVEVFRAGEYGARGSWQVADLDRLVAGYDAGVHEAPVTLDHAQEGPALGWVAGLRRAGDRLVARLRGLNPELLRLVREGAFKKRSVEIYRALNETGGPYLKAVSFLGAAAPAVKGLADPIFAEEACGTALPAGESDFFEFRDEECAGPGERWAELARELRREGRWSPAWERRGIAEFYAALAQLDEVPVGAAGEVAPAAWFAEFLRGLPATLPMGESAPGRVGVGQGGGSGMEFTPPARSRFDA